MLFHNDSQTDANYLFFSAAFTLIELLVVVSIIVILLALLVPAMDKAIYQSELAVCGAHLRGIAAGVSTYASGNARRYPHRPAVYEVSGKANVIKTRSDSGDDRPLVRDYYSTDIFQCPLTGTITMDVNMSDTEVYAPYYLWYGFEYGGKRGMKKLGDRLSWGDYRFDFLASDVDAMYVRDNGVYGTHPDHDGSLVQNVLQDEYHPGLLFVDIPLRFTHSRWETGLTHRRGPIEANYVLTDGSVVRYDKITWDDDRIVAIPDFMNASNFSDTPADENYAVWVPRDRSK
jgi:prepilin-type N-terminal cleavage/methylation domain-containing protein